VASTAAGSESRYIATNRFRTQEGKADAKFEKRWATRKSRLATLPGVKWGAVRRRVAAEWTECKDDAEAGFNYQSLTVWQNKDDFMEWRTGEAFKEAHGGGNFAGIVGMLVSSAQTLKGKPKPLMYRAQSMVSLPYGADELPEVVGGWRNVAATGEDLVQPECFVVMRSWRGEESAAETSSSSFALQLEKAKTSPGFKFGTVMTPDEKGKSEETTETTAWNSRSDWEAFAAAAKKDDERRPEPISTKLFEGKIVLTTEQGA
jgi:heme-degrading monooxygenase HmoA